jgi:hypothetical protein
MSETETLFEAAKTKKERPKMLTAEHVIHALRLRFPKDQYAFLREVGNSTGFKCRRHADAVVMGLWPSRGLVIIGIEVKVRRTDWLKELEQPEKAEEVAQYCDRWFVAAGDSEIVREGELPPAWGLLVPKDEKTLRCVKDAEQLADVRLLDRSFLAAMLRCAQGQLTGDAELKREFERGRTEGIQTAVDNTHWRQQRKLDELLELEKEVKEFEKASGVQIRAAWQLGKIGEAVRMITNGTYMKERENLAELHRKLTDSAERVQFAIGQLDAHAKDTP